MKIIRTEAGAYFIERSRFCIKQLSIAGNPYSWAVYDAEWVSDFDVSNGTYAPCVHECYFLENAFQFCADVLAGNAESKPILEPMLEHTPRGAEWRG